jgi:hypothetical protein
MYKTLSHTNNNSRRGHQPPTISIFAKISLPRQSEWGTKLRTLSTERDPPLACLDLLQHGHDFVKLEFVALSLLSGVTTL